MPTVRWIAVLSVVPLPLQQSAPPPSQSAVPSLLAWGDLDGDRRLDVAAITRDGELKLLWNDGEGRLRDRTAEAGLASVADAALACWADFDGDGRPDLFVGARAGASRLFRNDAGVLVDVTREAGIAVEEPVLDARWLDHDGDGRPDLHVATARGSRVFRGLEGRTFQEMAIELAPTEPTPSLSTAIPVTAPAVEKAEDPRTPAPERASNAHGGRVAVTASPAAGPGAPAPLTWTTGCMDTLADQSSPGACLSASSTPALGLLYPLSTDLFVALSGEVGIGTTSPAARLDVAGDARIDGPLTLDPGTDVALDLASGAIAFQGTRFVHGWEFAGNTAIGFEALPTVWAGSANTAVGSHALGSTTTGIANTAAGTDALRANTTGGENTAVGRWALAGNTSGDFNSGFGSRTLWLNTIGSRNVAVGSSALENNASGSWNVAVGRSAMSSNTTGGDNTAIGYQALFANTTASGSTAIGSGAMDSNTTGVQNTAVGKSALGGNTTGAGNTAVGYNALVNSDTAFYNTAVGAGALTSATASYNTAVGHDALNDSTSGFGNTAMGHNALAANTTGSTNVASGYQTLQSNTIGLRNIGIGESALLANVDGNVNTAVGALALTALASGHNNVALGANAAINLTSGSNNIMIGTSGAATENATIRIGSPGLHTRAFLGGVRGVTTSAANAIPVLVDSIGQLGTVSSSRRFKEDIRDMGELSDRLLALRPVVFRYREEVQAGERPLEYGLIAEEVAETFPELAVLDDEGQPFTVKYHVLGALLLNELQKQARELESLRARVAELEKAR